MNDRELLEMAAKAAGIHGEWSERGQCIVISGVGMSWEHWRPLEDDGDALRLAVKLKLLVSIDDFQVLASDGLYEWVESTYAKDPATATRRAITRAAAEIGRGMK